jgi:hypothetical protein
MTVQKGETSMECALWELTNVERAEQRAVHQQNFQLLLLQYLYLRSRSHEGKEVERDLSRRNTGTIPFLPVAGVAVGESWSDGRTVMLRMSSTSSESAAT